jgi:glutamyl-tRNA synthetase
MHALWTRDRTPIQSSRAVSHTRALLRLLETGFAYACRCSRRDVTDAQSAPHDTPLDLVYPGDVRRPSTSIRSRKAHDSESRWP